MPSQLLESLFCLLKLPAVCLFLLSLAENVQIPFSSHRGPNPPQRLLAAGLGTRMGGLATCQADITTLGQEQRPRSLHGELASSCSPPERTPGETYHVRMQQDE